MPTLLHFHADTDRKETVAEHLTGEHNSQFDHEAFLGKSESDKFDKLTPEEARRRLGKRNHSLGH